MARSDNQKEESPSHWHAQGMHHQQPNGFTRLNATTPNSVPPIHTANRQMPVYGQQSVPYYPQHTYMTPPPMKLVPYGYNRHVVLRMLIGPIDYPIFSYFSAFAMAGVLIYEFVKMNQLTGQIIATSPFNPMIGPSAWVLVNTGARFTPCIRDVPSFPVTETVHFCYQNATSTCTLEELCGFDGFGPSGIPNQSFRLVLPIFMHAGVVHFLMNMLTHLRLGVDLERALGTPRYFVLYMSSGIGGFIVSAMLSQNLSASMGCSGALFGLIGYMFIDLMVNWRFLPHPVRDLMGLLISTIISLVLGLLPGLDNFAHIGGFAVGLLLGIAIAPMRPRAGHLLKTLTWFARLISLVALSILFFVAIRAFYSSPDPSKICPNCKYLSCLPVNNWCDM